ncbi:MAG TPA: alpha/beta fold hydrolase [Candidatus Thermoplasmatota archaeon]|nr:alpha/beta fold hydrolase [Candidatus Thermoplasmatota archaeon]
MERKVAGALVQSLWLRDRRGGPWFPPAHLKHTPVAFEGNTGARIAGTWFPADKPRGAVVLAHPDKRYAKHWFVKEGYVELLLSEGYDVLTFDFTGYGESHGPATYYHEDLLAAARFADHWAGGFPIHVLGVSMGAFAAANASPHLDFVRTLILESPYPSFNAWYAKGASKLAIEAFDALFPATGRAIKADANIARAAPTRILIASSTRDEVTPPALTKRVADAAPADRTRVHELDAPHLGFLQDPNYREAMLATLAA